MGLYLEIAFVTVCALLTEAIEYSNNSAGYSSQQGSESNHDAENRKKPCLEYGQKCLREGENDRCCLRQGGMCKTDPKTQKRLCTPRKSDTPWELLLIDKLLNVGFSGGAAWVKETGEVKGKKGSGNFVTQDDIKRSDPFYSEETLQKCIPPNTLSVIYGPLKYQCRGYRVLYESSKLVSAWLQGETADYHHGVMIITTLRYVVIGFHETRDMGLNFAYHHMDMLHDLLADLEERGEL